jgi:hypothetical protein
MLDGWHSGVAERGRRTGHTAPHATPDSPRGHRGAESVQLPQASVNGLPGLRRGTWGTNSLVHICTKFISTTGSSPTSTGASCQATTRIYKVSRWFASLIGQT